MNIVTEIQTGTYILTEDFFTPKRDGRKRDNSWEGFSVLEKGTKIRVVRYADEIEEEEMPDRGSIGVSVVGWPRYAQFDIHFALSKTAKIYGSNPVAKPIVAALLRTATLDSDVHERVHTMLVDHTYVDRAKRVLGQLLEAGVITETQLEKAIIDAGEADREGQ